MNFDLHIGIDYSGRKTPKSRTPALQVYASFESEKPRRIPSPASTENTVRNWCRKEIAEWLIYQARNEVTFVAGIDHGFSFPANYFERHKLKSWPDFLNDFCKHWPTDGDDTYVDLFRHRDDGPPDRTGDSTDLRLTEKWTSSAKSVFKFDVQGSVAKSTHAGIPWLRHIRDQVPERVHFWPFDGWEVPTGKSVIAEAYPAIFKNRYPREGRNTDQQDAYSVARWLSESNDRGILDQYLRPSLTAQELEIADLEGWILGIL